MPMLLHPMRHLTLLLALLSGLLCGLRSAAALDVGDKAPDFTLRVPLGNASACISFGAKNTSSLSFVRAFGPT